MRKSAEPAGLRPDRENTAPAVRRGRRAGRAVSRCLALGMAALLTLFQTGCGRQDLRPVDGSTVAPPSGYRSEERAVNTFPVTMNAQVARILENPMGELSQEKKDLLKNLPGARLPRELPDHGENGVLAGFLEEDLWQDLLLPLCADSESDVTLYGVVAGGVGAPSAMMLLTDGIVMRCGDHAVYWPLDWSANAWYVEDPWMQVADLDGDGTNEIAICLNLGGGTGTDAMQLYILEMDTLQYKTVDLSTLRIDAEWDPEARTITLTTEGEEPLVADIDTELETDDVTSVTSQYITEFEWRDGQLWFQTLLDAEGSTLYFAQAEAPVIWAEDEYRLGQITLKLL